MKVAVLPTDNWLDRNRVSLYLAKLAEKHPAAIIITTKTYVERAARKHGLRVASIRLEPAMHFDLGPRPSFRERDWNVDHESDDPLPADYVEARARYGEREREYGERLKALCDVFALVLTENDGEVRERPLLQRITGLDVAETEVVRLAVDLSDQVVVFEREPPSLAAAHAELLGRPCQILR